MENNNNNNNVEESMCQNGARTVRQSPAGVFPIFLLLPQHRRRTHDDRRPRGSSQR